jgi:hypothetical protein
LAVRIRLRISRRTKIALLTLWGIIALFAVTNLSEDARGDSSLIQLVPWDVVAGAILTAVILGIEALGRTVNRFANPY